MEKPILFNSEMVRAILDGRKTVTRRIAKTIANYITDGEIIFANIKTNKRSIYYSGHKDIFFKDYAPYKVGDILYVRETWNCIKYNSMDGDLGYGVKFKDGTEKYFEFDDNERFHQFGGYALKQWQPSLFMPREAARIFLKVTDVRVEKIKEISIQDMINEGIKTDGIITSNGPIEYRVINRFEELWNSTVNKKDLGKYGFDSNCWCWVIEFERVEKP